MPNSESHNRHIHNPEALNSLNAAFIIGISLNATYVIVEAVFGFLYNLMGLLSDAGHNLSDVASLVVSMVAFKLMSRKPNSRFTYGYKKFSIQASLFNAMLLYLAVGAILVEAIRKLIHPVAVDGDAIAWVAAAGVVVNGVTAWLFMKGKNRDMNVKSAFEGRRRNVNSSSACMAALHNGECPYRSLRDRGCITTQLHNISCEANGKPIRHRSHHG